MSLGPSVALVAAGLAVAGGTSYVSLMQGEFGSRAPAAERMLNDASAGASIHQLSAYLDATFSSLRSTTATEVMPRREVTASITPSSGPRPSFSDRFAGLVSDVVAPSAPSRGIAAPKVRVAAAAPPPPPPKVRVAALRIDARDAAPAEQKPYQLAAYAPTRDDSASAIPPFNFHSDIRVPPLRQAITSLVPMASAPFPFDGVVPGTSRKFINVVENGRRGHRTFRGRVLWEDQVFNDSRVLLHIPKGFDVNKPSVMIVFFHGHGATLTRDVLERQQVPEQISESGANAVLVAPQLAFDAADSSPGKLWESGGFARFVQEAGEQLARLYGDPRAARTFANMPIVVVAYSGGYVSAATSLQRGGIKNRVQGVVLLDALYGEFDGFASWISHNRSGFFVSSYTRSTHGGNKDLEQMLSERDVTFSSALKAKRLDGSVTFLPGDDGIRHRDFVNHAWADKPIKDILTRLPDIRL
jgi:hypothetical protein